MCGSVEGLEVICLLADPRRSPATHVSSFNEDALSTVWEVGALMGIHSSGVLTLSVSGQGNSLGWDRNSGMHTSVGITVWVVGAGLWVHSSWVLVTTGTILDVVVLGVCLNWRLGLCLGSGIYLRLGRLPLGELLLDVAGSKVPDGGGKLRLNIMGNGSSVPLRLRLGLDNRSSIPLRLGSDDWSRFSGEVGIVPALVVLSILNQTGRSNRDLNWSWGRSRLLQSGGHSGNSVCVPQGILVDGKGASSSSGIRIV